MPKRKLPDDSILLRERDFEGLSLPEIAARYHVTEAAVSVRFKKMGRPFRPVSITDYREILPWDIQGKDGALDAAIRLRSHVRHQLGENVSEAAQKRLQDWWRRLDREKTVLTYEPGDAGSPWHYLPRDQRDGNLIVRWPAAAPPPTAQQTAILSFPSLS